MHFFFCLRNALNLDVQVQHLKHCDCVIVGSTTASLCSEVARPKCALVYFKIDQPYVRMQHVSHSIGAVSMSPTALHRQSLTITAISKQAPQIFPSLDETVFATLSANPLDDIIWPESISIFKSI